MENENIKEMLLWNGNGKTTYNEFNQTVNNLDNILSSIRSIGIIEKFQERVLIYLLNKMKRILKDEKSFYIPFKAGK